MANGTEVPALGELKAFHEMVDILVRNIKDKKRLPLYRHLTRKLERELWGARVDGSLGLHSLVQLMPVITFRR